MQPVHFGNGEYYPLQELTLGQAIKIAECNQHEKKLTLLLQGILGNQLLPYQMSAQQRQYALLHYFKETGVEFENIDLNHFMLNQPPIESIEIENITFRQLNGFECEAISNLAKNRSDYILMSLALTVGCDELDEIIPCSDVVYAEKIIKGRLEMLNQISVSHGVHLLESYYIAQDQLNYLVNLTCDDSGFVIYGETLDCPMRFPISTLVPTIITDLFTKPME